MRILLLHSSSDIYGASKIFLQTVALLRKRGHDCTVALSSMGPLQEELEKHGSKVQIINLGILRRQYFNPIGIINRFIKLRNASKQLSAIIQSEQIELVYSNTAAVLIGAWVARKNKIAHYWHLHEIIEKPKVLHAFLVWCMQTGADKIITVSDAVSACWKDAGKIVRVYNGIEPIPQIATTNLRAQYNIPDDAIVLGVAGRIHIIKGQSYFLNIASELLKLQSNTNTSTKIYFLIAGDPFPGQEYLVDQMLTKINELHLNNTVHYIGMVQNMADFYNAIDVLVVSSVLPDSLPTVILEAMQFSLPVVATAQGGAMEMIISQNNNYTHNASTNPTGILIPINNATVAAENINQLISKDIRLQMGAAGKQRVEEYFSVSAFEKNILSVIES